MQFPDNVDSPRSSKTRRAKDRLQYLMKRASMKLTGEGSVRALARSIGMDHSTLLYHLKNGRCSPGVALRIEETCGRDHTPNEWLRNPLDVVPDGKPE